MANQARDALGVERLDVVADKGYYKSKEILACEDDDITVTLPKVAAGRHCREEDEEFLDRIRVYTLPCEKIWTLFE